MNKKITIADTNIHFSTEHNKKRIIINSVLSSAKVEDSKITKDELEKHYDKINKSNK